jgi:hypothetical protein
MAAIAEEDLVPELGDKVTIVSNVFKKTTGRIVYRDDKLIRIRPDYRATSGINFPLDPVTQLFRESLGVSEVIIHEKRTNPAFAAQLAVFRNDRVLFYSEDGEILGSPGIVERVVTSDTEDAIVLTDGRVIDFGFVGPADPIGIILPYQEEEGWAAAPPVVATFAEEEEAPTWEAELDINPIVAPPTVDDRTYDDVTQRERMFLSLLQAQPYNQQKNPKLMARLYREVDLLIALKNALVVRDASKAIVFGKQRSYVARTLKDIMDLEPVPALIPVVAVKKVLYVDKGENEERLDAMVRNDTQSIINTLRAASVYDVEGRNGFAAYIQEIAKSNRVFSPVEAEPTYTRYDRDVFRSRLPPHKVEGFASGLPGGYKIGRFQSRGNSIELDASWISMVDAADAGLSRLLTGTYVDDPLTGVPFLVAEADPIDSVGHVLLSKDATLYQQPLRSSVLLWDILASDRLRSHTQPFTSYLKTNWESQRVIQEGTEVVLSALVRQRAPPALSFVQRDTVRVLDSLGLRSLEMTGELIAALRLTDSQELWRASHEARRQRSLGSRERTSQSGPLLSSDTALLEEPVLSDPLLKTILPKTVTATATTAAATTAAAAASPTKANAVLVALTQIDTITPYWIALANHSEEGVVDSLRATAEAETRRIRLASETRLAVNARFKSKPKFNPCKHVMEIEKIRNIRDTHKRMDMLEKYIQINGAGQAGHWILCGLCKLPLVCKHEVLLLQEFRHPGRGKILHKTLLLDYASPYVYEGSYICKRCGQPIQRLEYDTSIEFGDDGVPLSGRTVLTDEPEQTEETEEIDLMEEAADSYTGEDKKYYHIARIILERCGMSGTQDLYKGMISAAKDYLGVWVPAEEYYNQQKEKARKAAEAAAAAAKAAGKKAPEARIPPEYRKFVANFQVTAMAALVVLELQTSGAAVPFPAPGCQFSTEGFPLDGDNPETDGKGALSYVSCVVAGIYRSDMPWKFTTWSSEMDLMRRRSAVLGAVQGATLRFLGLPAVPPLTTVTEHYRKKIQAKREARASSTSSVTLPSRGDVLPAAFRPLPFLKPQGGGAAAVANEAAFVRDMQTRPYAEVERYIVSRGRALTHTVLTEFTAVASKSIQRHPMRSEGICCPTPLQDVKQKGIGYESLPIVEATKKEITVITHSALTDAAASANGTHVLVPWSAPVNVEEPPALQPGQYYKLYLKKCAKGRNVGMTHEFHELPTEDLCRHCGFRIPAELRYLKLSDISETKPKKIEKKLAEQEVEREVKALAAIEEQGIPVTEEAAFQALEMAVKKRGLIRPSPPVEERGTFALLQAIMVPPGVLFPDAAEDWEIMLEALRTIQERSLTGVRRAQEWAKFAARSEEMIRDVVRDLYEKNASASDHDVPEELDKIMRATLDTPLPTYDAATIVQEFVEMTARPVVAAHTLLHYLVTCGEQTLTRPYTNDGKANNLPLKKWFPSVNRDHLEILRMIWIRSDAPVRPFYDYLKAPSVGGRKKRGAAAAAAGVAATEEEPTYGGSSPKNIVKRTMSRMVAWLGPVLGHFIRSFRNSSLVMEDEWATLLQFLIGSVAKSLLNEGSPLYADANHAVMPEVTQFFALFLQGMLTAASVQFKRYQRTDDEIREVLRVREEIEKSIFMKRFATLDKSLRDIEVIKKSLKLGDWGQGRLENLVNYRKETVGFQLGQIKSMGLNEFGDHIGEQQQQQQQPPETAAERIGLRRTVPESAGEGAYENRAAMDEDAT